MATTPQRIQLHRTKGWRKPEGAIVVARPSKWGNPATLAMVVEVESQDPRLDSVDLWSAHAFAVQWYRVWLNMDEAKPLLVDLHELRGHDLACWCPLDSPCHADVLLRLANT